LHVWNSYPVGIVALNPGPLLAGVHSFEITIHGKGGHGAAPHETVDAIVTAAQVITNLQTVVSRNTDPLESAVVTVGSIHAGNAFNVIAEKVVLIGTARYFRPAIGDALPVWIERVIRGTAESMGARYELKYEKLTPSTINDPAMAKWSVSSAKKCRKRK
jgi:amidohydrolase